MLSSLACPMVRVHSPDRPVINRLGWSTLRLRLLLLRLRLLLLWLLLLRLRLQKTLGRALILSDKRPCSKEARAC